MSLISLVVPCYNESGNIDEFVNEVGQMWQKSGLKDDYEIVFIDDGSKDNTVLKIYRQNKKNKRVKLVKLSRNFGKESAVSAGLKYIKGDAGIIVDADLQYPIEKIPEFIEKWKAGAKHVVGLRDEKKTDNTLEKLGSKIFNKLINLVGEQKFDSKALDFRLIDRQVIDEFNHFKERQRMVRGLLDWLGYDPVYIKYSEKERLRGVSGFDFKKRLNLALNTLLNYSVKPLQFVGVLGFVVTFLSLILMIFVASDLLMDRKLFYFSGSFMLATFNTFMNGIVLMCLGLVAYYIGGIKNEVLNRPVFVVDEFLE